MDMAGLVGRDFRHSWRRRFAGVASVTLVFGLTVAGVGVHSVAAAMPAECAQGGTTVTCTYTTAGFNTFHVPAGVTGLHVVAIGGMGGQGSGGGGTDGQGGLGAKVSADIAATPGSTLYAYVGGNGATSVAQHIQDGGANGGGRAVQASGSGGGASDVRGDPNNLATRLIVAGGGGGGGSAGDSSDFFDGFAPAGGDGGNAGEPGHAGGTYDDGTSNATGGTGGGAGTANGGGAAGTAGTGQGVAQNGCDTATAGTLAQGGNGALIEDVCGPGGGGGGGGVYGGGGGGAPGSVQFTPDQAGAGGGGGGSSLVPAGGTITTDATGVPKVVISYTVPDTVTPTSITFGDTALGATSASHAVTLSNTGAAVINVSSIAFVGANPGDFVISADTCSGQAVAPGASCTAQIAFRPTATGSRSATVSLSDDAPDSPQSVALSGNGTTSADVAVAITGPTSTQSRAQASYSVAVSNNGPSIATNVVVNAVVPNGTQFVGLTSTKGSCTFPKKNATSGAITCSLGNFASGQNSLTVVTLKVVLNSKGANVVFAVNAASTTAGSSSATPDPNLANNTASITTTVTK